MKDAFNQKQMFQQLLTSFLPTYDIIRDAINSQGKQNIDVLIQRLLKKESLFKADKKAFAIRSQSEYTRH
jgi:predicted transcriptional regulator